MNNINTLVKKEDRLFIVEVVSVSKKRYAIRGETIIHAYDTIVCQEATPFETTHIDDSIFNGKEINEQEFLEKEFDILDPLTNEEKVKLIHNINYNS
ncbi:hypothetical protein GW796_07185 [archaeon]|nr:hypothetical protein [archaeon]NCQ51666.1 hypothetical protein [archaeon]